MGYILPIIPYQLMQYAERELAVKHDSYQFVPTPKVMNEMKYERYVEKKGDWEKQQQKGKRQAEDKRVVPPCQQQTVLNDVIYAELTGKGRAVSEYI